MEKIIPEVIKDRLLSKEIEEVIVQILKRGGSVEIKKEGKETVVVEQLRRVRAKQPFPSDENEV